MAIGDENHIRAIREALDTGAEFQGLEYELDCL